MTEEEAKAEAIRRWHALPETERKTMDRAAEFAQKLALSGLTYDGCSHPYHAIKDWLRRELRD